MSVILADTEAVVSVEAAEAPGPFLFVCEHASNCFPAPFGTLGLSKDQQNAHIAWDPGALNLARGMAQRLESALVAAKASRLIYDCNRPPDAAGAMAEKSEAHDIAGNFGLSPEARIARTRAIYLPFHAALHAQIAERLAAGRETVLVTVHSFTPTWFGTPRDVELGVIHDADPTLALAFTAEAQAQTGLNCALNEPYSAADGVTHLLRLHAYPYALRNIMLEIRNDLIATPADADAMAAKLAPALAAAHADLNTQAARSTG